MAGRQGDLTGLSFFMIKSIEPTECILSIHVVARSVAWTSRCLPCDVVSSMSKPKMSLPGCRKHDVVSSMSKPKMSLPGCRKHDVVTSMSKPWCLFLDVHAWVVVPWVSKRKNTFTWCRNRDVVSRMSQHETSFPGCRSLCCHSLGVEACERWSTDAFQSILMEVAQLRSHSSTCHLIECAHNCALRVSLVREMLKLWPTCQQELFYR